MQGTEESRNQEESTGAARLLVAGEETWVVREAGSTRSGTGSDAGAPLLLLTFAREEDPGLPVREVMVVGASFEDLSEAELEEGLARSRAFRERPDGIG